MAEKGKGGAVNYDDMKAKLKEFLAGYHKVNDRGQKEFVYARQITDISHREQVCSLLLTVCSTFDINRQWAQI